MAMILATILLAVLTQGAKRKISDVYVLLPLTLNNPNARHVIYTIQAYEGCYKWTSANSKIVAVSPLTHENFSFDPDCQNPALVREFQGLECYPGAQIEAIASVELPPITLVAAIDQTSRGETLKCEVKIARVHRLEILTTVKGFRVHDSQKLYAQAFDEEGNVFTALEGLRFRWQIVTGSESLYMPKLKDSLTTLSKLRKEVESLGFQSDMILVQGHATGVANVTLKIEEPGYEKVPISSTLIYISEPFAVVPSPEVYLPVCSKFRLKVFKITEDKLHKEVRLPSRDYTWTSSSEYIEVKDTGELSTLGKEGKWNVIVRDSKIENNFVQCEVNVVRPDKIAISIMSDFRKEEKESYSFEEFQEIVNQKETSLNNWYLIAGQRYRVKVTLYWRNRVLDPPKNAVFEINFEDNKLWKVLERSENGGELVVEPVLSQGYNNNIYPTQITAKLDRFEGVSRANCGLDFVLTQKEEVSIIKKVKISEDKPILLPYFAVLSQTTNKLGPVPQDYQIKITGGSFSLRWYSSDPSIVSVSKDGIVYAHRLGKAKVSVVDSNNEQNTDSTEIEVALVEKLIWNNERVEMVKEASDIVKVLGLATGSRVFTDCSAIFLKWEHLREKEILSFGSKISVSEEEKKKGVCEIRHIEGKNEGQAVITANLINSPSEVSQRSPEIRLNSAEGRIGIFLPLSLVQNEDYKIIDNNKTYTYVNEQNAVVLVPGSSSRLELVGGPWPWDDLQSSYKEVVQNEIGKIVQRKTREKRYVELTCGRTKDHDVTIKVFNEASSKLPSPGYSEIQLKVACHPPTRLQLNWVQRRELLENVNYKSTPAYFERFSRKLSQKFHENYWVVLNEQDLMVNVTLWDPKGRPFLNFSSVQIDWLTDKQDLISYKKDPTEADQRIVRIGASEGSVVLEARIDKLADGTALPGISSSLNNEVVKNVDLSIKEYSLYLHGQSVVEIHILYGSGSFEVSVNMTEIVQFTYDGYRKILVFPKKTGKATIKVIDTALEGSVPTYCNILVSQLAAIELKEGGLIPVEGVITLSLQALDSDGRPFSVSELKWMGFELSYQNAFNLVSVSSNYAEWELRGVRIGEFQVQALGFKISEKGETVRSNLITIDVFPPLEIIPPKILLLPGAKYSLSYKGGPDPAKYGYYSIQLTWLSENEHIGLIDANSGLVTANHVGETSIILQMYKKQTLLTKASGVLKVRLVTNLSILNMNPGRTVLIDSATRLISQLYYNGEEFTESSIPIDYTWKSNSPAVYSIFQENQDVNKQIAVTGLALAAGKSDITLHAKIYYPEEYKDQESNFYAKVTASVDSALIVQTPSHRCHSYFSFNCGEEFTRWLDSTLMLLPNHAAFRLPLSKEEKNSFRCMDCREDLLRVSENGLLVSGGQKGESSVVIQNSKIRGDLFVLPVVVTDIESIHIDRSYLSHTMALGSEMELDIVYQDIMARSFPKNFESGIDVSLEISNSRVLQGSLENRNSTLKIYSHYAGETIVKVYLTKNPKVKDLIKISVNTVMRPVSPIYLPLGGEIQFETTHSTPAGVFGTWTSDNNNVISVNDKGLARSLQEGDTFIHYKEKGMDLRSSVFVSRVKALDLAYGAPFVITNFEKHANFREKYKVPIRLYLDTEKTKEVPKLTEDQKKNIKQGVHVRCSTNTHADFVLVESEIDRYEKERSSEEPGFGCIVTPISNPSSSLMAGKDLVLNVVVSAKGKSLYVYEGSVTVPFISKFWIAEKQVVLSGRKTSQTVTVSGSCGSIQVNSESSAIGCKKYEQGGRCLIDVWVIDSSNEIKFNRVNAVDSVTGQKEEIVVNYYTDPAKADLASPISLNDLLVLIALIVLLYVVYSFFKGNAQQPMQPAYRNLAFQPPRYPPQGRVQTPGPTLPAGPASSPGSSNFKNIAYRPNF